MRDGSRAHPVDVRGAGTIAVFVYEVVGPAVLGHAWFNPDRLWAAALITAGATTLLITA